METAAGVVDVKSSPVYFYVQRNEPYNISGTIPFQNERLNVGRGMNITSGIFTAPKSGIYFFSFSGVKDVPANALFIDLYRISDYVTYITSAIGANVAGLITATLSLTLSLKSGDQISLRLYSGQLYDDNVAHYTNFIGMLLQEDLF